jgi:hypothetical protein
MFCTLETVVTMRYRCNCTALTASETSSIIWSKVIFTEAGPYTQYKYTNKKALKT